MDLVYSTTFPFFAVYKKEKKKVTGWSLCLYPSLVHSKKGKIVEYARSTKALP